VAPVPRQGRPLPAALEPGAMRAAVGPGGPWGRQVVPAGPFLLVDGVVAPELALAPGRVGSAL
jgi:hypothetical protein